MKSIKKKTVVLLGAAFISLVAGCSKTDFKTASHIVSSVTTHVAEAKPMGTHDIETQSNSLAKLNFDGKDQVITLNHNHTTFSTEDLSLKKGSWQTFSNLDSINRVGVANAMLSKSMMPKEKREPLYVNPSGWKNKKIIVNGKSEWIYNRCHLIGYQFTGQNNNPKNLMTGTRSFNDPGMLIYENKVAAYLKETNHHVRYQVEPIFKGTELVARGVHMQAKSIEDNKLEFNVYVFNVEPGVTINYQDGTSKLDR